VQVRMYVEVAVSAPVDWEPFVALLPDQLPDAEHAVALVDDQFSTALAPLLIELGLALKVTVGAGAVTVTVADCAAVPPVPEHVRVKVELAVSTPVDCEPLIPLVPDQAPEAVQDVALVADQLTVELLPLATVLGLADRLIVGTG
jgi:hypothetical protein